MEIVSDRPLTIGSDTFRAGLPFTVEDWRGTELIRAGTARHAVPPDILYETRSRQQNADALGEQGVTCVCLTRNRRGWLPQAITNYVTQTYQPRELLIIADGVDVRDLVPEREDIRLIQIEEGRTIGEKRNFGVQHARSKFVAHWDDDDFSAPDRLADQMFRLRASGMPVSGYSQIDFTNGSSWWRYSGDRDFAPGSSLLYEKAWALDHPFLAIQIGEDGEFVRTARELGKIVTASSPGMLTATVHPDNTSPRNLTDRFWEKMERSESGMTVIIPSKTLSNARPCVDAIRDLSPSARIVVVNDGVEDAESLGVDLVPGEKPFIFSRAVNAGIRFAGRDDVLLLNDDAILKSPGGFSALQAACKSHPQFGLIGSTCNAVGNRNQLPGRRAVNGLREDPRMVCFVAVFIPRSTLDAVGWMDERFTAYGFEDDDYCYRVRRAGLKIGIHDGCFVDHASLKSTFRGDPLTSAKLESGMKIFTDKWGSYPL